MNMEYYICIHNEKRGPYTLEELQARGINAETLVSSDGQQWTPAWQLSELRVLIETGDKGQELRSLNDKWEMTNEETGNGKQEFSTQTPQQPISQTTNQPNTQTTKRRRSYGGCLLALLIAAIIGATFVFTCPDEQAHKAQLTTLMSNAMSEVMEKNMPADGDLVTKGIQMVGGILMDKVVDAAVDNMLSVDNYVVCSLGKVHYEGKDHIVSLGLLGHIFTVNQQEATKAAEKYYLDFQQKAEKNVEDQIRQNVVDPIKDALQDALGGLINGIAGNDEGEEPLSDIPSEDEAEH